MNSDYGGNRGSARTGVLTVMAAAAVLAAMTACGGNASSASSAGSASVGPAGQNMPSAGADHPTVGQLLKLAQCMRAHGMRSFPNPTGTGQVVTLQGGIDFSAPQFKSAARACKSLTPAGLFPSGS